MAGMRATDQDRDSAVETIEDAYAKGQLNDAERESRTQQALQATTQGELAQLVADLRPAPPIPRAGPSTSEPISTRRLAIVIGVVTVGLMVTGVIIAGAYSGSDDPTSLSVSGNSSPEVKGKLLTRKGLTALIAAVDRKFGTTVVSDAVIYPEYAVFTVPVAGNTRHTERWYFRGKFDDKAQSTGNRAADDMLIDLAQANVPALIDWVGKAGTELNVQDVKSTYLIFDERNDKPSMSVYASNSFNDSGYASLNLDGSVLYVYAFK